MKKTVLLFICTFITNLTYPMKLEIRNPLYMHDESSSVSFAEQRRYQTPYPQWEKVTKTKEFRKLAQLLKQNPCHSDKIYTDLFKQLCATTEFKAYMATQNTLETR